MDKGLQVYLILFSIMLIHSRNLKAYPNMISLGYESCMSCHYNPHGNGPLTDYGRALSATEISDKKLWNANKSEEKIVEQSGFFLGENPLSWLRPSISFRGLSLFRNADEVNRAHNYINMDTGLGLVGKFLKRDRLVVVGQFGYAPKPRSLSGQDNVKLFRSREHYVGYRLSKQVGVYVGLLDKVYGIRVPDHTAYSRAITGLNQNDQAHGVVLHVASGPLELGVQPFVGNLVQDKDLRQKGVTGMLEYSLEAKNRVGFSLLSSSSKYLERRMFSGHLRQGFGHGHSILVELGNVNNLVKSTSKKKSSRYIFSQAHYRLRRGGWFFFTGEYLLPEVGANATHYRAGPGFQYFPVHGVELRTDVFYSYKVLNSDSNDQLDFATQLHLYF